MEKIRIIKDVYFENSFILRGVCLNFVYSARVNQAEAEKLNQNVKMLQEELSKSVMRCNQAEDARQISERKAGKYEEQLRELSQQVR